MNTTLSQTTSQQQHLTHDMALKLSVLQAATIDLQSLAEKEAEQNPVLEVEPKPTSSTQLPDESAPEWTGQSPAQDDSAYYPPKANYEDEERHRYLMESLTKAMTLAEHLEAQLVGMDLTPETREHVVLLMDWLNHNGWLNEPLEIIAAAEKVPLEALQKALSIIQMMEPAGIGAKDLQQCLTLQLERNKQEDTLAYRILTEAFDLLSRRRFDQLAQRLQTDRAGIAEAVQRITSLDPRPAQRFEMPNQEPMYIRPELIVEKVDGQWAVKLKQEYTPVIRINSYYKNLMTDEATPRDTKEYIREQVKKGRFFMSCLEQRGQTIQRVAEAIVERQQEYFDEGPDKLHPMRMADIAGVMGMHESTISRAVGGKFMETPHGVVELRSFFSSGVETTTGPQVSSRTLEAAIQRLVKAEDSLNPMTDEQLSAKLMEEDIRIGRRTVVKYRERLGIPASALRRQC